MWHATTGSATIVPITAELPKQAFLPVPIVRSQPRVQGNPPTTRAATPPEPPEQEFPTRPHLRQQPSLLVQLGVQRRYLLGIAVDAGLARGGLCGGNILQCIAQLLLGGEGGVGACRRRRRYVSAAELLVCAWHGASWEAAVFLTCSNPKPVVQTRQQLRLTATMRSAAYTAPHTTHFSRSS